jgi:hypothetical protein
MKKRTNVIEYYGVKAQQAPSRSTLTEKQLERIRKIHFSEFDQVLLAGKHTLKECEIDFMRDATPDREILTWEAMVETYSQYVERHPTADRLAVAKKVSKVAAFLRPIELDNGQTVGPPKLPPGSAEHVELFEAALLKSRD